MLRRKRPFKYYVHVTTRCDDSYSITVWARNKREAYKKAKKETTTTAWIEDITRASTGRRQ